MEPQVSKKTDAPVWDALSTLSHVLHILMRYGGLEAISTVLDRQKILGGLYSKRTTGISIDAVHGPMRWV